MDCCSSGAKMSKEASQNDCHGCGETGRPVSRQTVVHHVKSEKLSLVGEEEYKFCSSPECAVVYYAASGQAFTVGEVREPVTSKTLGDERPLCYCFGFTERSIILQKKDDAGRPSFVRKTLSLPNLL